MLVVEATLPLWCAAALVPAAKPVAARRDVLLGVAAAAATAATSGPSAAVANTAVPKSAVGVTESGVKYFDVKEGNGGSPRPGQLVIVKYQGFLSDGRMFDSSDGPGRKPIAAKFKAKPAQLLPGWEEVLETMRVGGTRVAQVPPELAYGKKGICLEDGSCLVPPDERLQFELTLERIAESPI